MTPFQQLYLGLGAKKKTYMDDVFSSYLYEGNATGSGTAHQIVNGINNNKYGGAVWIKSRSSSYHHILLDSVRVNSSGQTQEIYPSNNSAATGPYAGYNITAFNTDGFKLEGNGSNTNKSGDDYVAWNFRKAKGFFDIVQYTGNGSNRTISHSLGCVPGMILVKCTSETRNWIVYHRNLVGSTGNEENAGTALMMLDTTEGVSHNDEYWNDTEPTSTHFSVGTQSGTNKNGETYIAYLFAGGESTAATARSVDMDGTGDYINTTSSSSDFTMGTGDFTVECWVKADTYDKGIFQISNSAGGITPTGYQSDISLWTHNNGRLGCALNGTNTYGSTKLTKGHWHHVAITRASGTAYIFLDGTLQFSGSEPTNYDGTYIAIGGYYDTSYLWDGEISNFRVVKGTALYTSSFRPPTEPLTNITNTKLLCCNNSSVTGSTVSPVTLYEPGDPQPSTDSPFDDPAAFTFGENGDQGIIKMGSYVGNGSSTGPEINLGWEPQWVMFKRTSGGNNSDSWYMADSMRGIIVDTSDPFLAANETTNESGGTAEGLALTSTGFKLTASGNWVNASGQNYVYIAIRRPDGYVGKPAEVGTDVFAMDTGAGSSTIPNFDSGFPVDFALNKWTSTTSDWYAGARLLQGKRLEPNTIDGAATAARWVFDSNTGWNDFSTFDSGQQSWMWKRHAGFDVVTYDGNAVAGRAIPHGLSKAPEMIWIKARAGSVQWCIGHKGRNGGVNPWNYFSAMNGDGADEDNAIAFNDTAPTSTHFTVGGADATANQTSYTYIAMLFASVDGISKCGFYDGSASDQTITTGFQPRFVIIKCTSDAGDWCIWDTTRGWASGNDSRLVLNSTSAASTNVDVGNPTSTGFVVGGSQNTWNNSGRKYIYYAHA